LPSIQIQPRKVSTFKMGMSDSLFSIETDKEKYMLRLYPDKNKESVQEEIALLRKIGECNDLMVYPLNEKPITVAKKYGYVYEFFNGEILGKISNPNYFEAGRILAKLHLALQNFPLQEKEFDFFKGKERIEQISRIVASMKKTKNKRFLKVSTILEKGYSFFLEYAEKIKRKDLTKCRIQPIHGDINSANIIVNKATNKYFIIDTGSIRYGSIAEDIENCMRFQLCENDKENIDNFTRLIQGYNSLFALQEIERALIPLFLISKELASIHYVWCLFMIKHEISKAMFFRYFNFLVKFPVFIKNKDALIDVIMSC